MQFDIAFIVGMVAGFLTSVIFIHVKRGIPGTKWRMIQNYINTFNRAHYVAGLKCPYCEGSTYSHKSFCIIKVIEDIVDAVTWRKNV